MGAIENAGPSAEEVFNEYFKKSQSVIGTLNPNIFGNCMMKQIHQQTTMSCHMKVSKDAR